VKSREQRRRRKYYLKGANDDSLDAHGLLLLRGCQQRVMRVLRCIGGEGTPLTRVCKRYSQQCNFTVRDGPPTRF
jgi:hypothetical protein